MHETQHVTPVLIVQCRSDCGGRHFRAHVGKGGTLWSVCVYDDNAGFGNRNGLLWRYVRMASLPKETLLLAESSCFYASSTHPQFNSLPFLLITCSWLCFSFFLYQHGYSMRQARGSHFSGTFHNYEFFSNANRSSQLVTPII